MSVSYVNWLLICNAALGVEKRALVCFRVRTGYGILEKLWNFEKEIPYMEKLWNLSQTVVPMEKLWNFCFGGKKCSLSLKKNGGKIIMSGLRNVVSMFFFASVITSLGLALRTSRAIALASAE